MTDRWSDPDLVLALFQAALAVPLAVAVLAMLATFAALGLAALVGATAPFFWRHRRWTAIALGAVVAGMFCDHAYWALGLVPYGERPGDVLAGLAGVFGGTAMQLVLIAARWLWERRWWRQRMTPPLPPVPQMWTAESLRAMTHNLVLYEAMRARPWLDDPQVNKTIHIPRLSHLSRDPKPLTYETEDGQRAEIWIDGKPYALTPATATQSYIVTEDGMEPVQNKTQGSDVCRHTWPRDGQGRFVARTEGGQA